MAPSPVIPTSFVPKQPVQSATRYTKSGNNAFLLVASIIFGLSVLSAIGTFGYQKYLEGVQKTKAAEVAQAERDINKDAVEEFVRTRDRFVAGQTLLDDHVAASQFFDLLESVTLQGVRFDSLSFELADDRTAEIRMTGVARSFNALAAQSSLLSEEKRIKRAIFSEITVTETGTVSFALAADLAPELLLLEVPAEPIVPVQPVATSTATTTNATTTTP